MPWSILNAQGWSILGAHQHPKRQWQRPFEGYGRLRAHFSVSLGERITDPAKPPDPAASQKASFSTE
jgi:hypothetical protein